MKQFILLFILFCTYSFTVQAQNKNNSLAEGFSTTSSGLQYKIIKDSVRTIYPEAGGFITFWFELRTNNDSIYDSQFADPQPVGIPTPAVTYKPSIEEGFLLLTDGDSALFVLNADSLYKNTFRKELPDFILKGSSIHMIVKMRTLYSKYFVDSVMAITEAREAAAREIYERDSVIIQKYLKDHNLKGKAAEGGVYIVKIKSVSAQKPYIVKGETIETKYIGKRLIEGTEFNRSGDNYFEFTVGFGEVIKGWDYAFQRLKVGEKALILIPSGAAYGDKGFEVDSAVPHSPNSTILPNSPLLFEVTIKKD